MINEFKIKKKQIILSLKSVIDPELMINIVDLGLVYKVTLNEEEKLIEIDITLTSQGCPLGDAIMEEVQQTTEMYHPDYKVNVNLVWEPEWSTEMITEDGKAALGR